MKKLMIAVVALSLTSNAAFADGDKKLEGKVKIKRDEAKSIALKNVPGTIQDSDLERRKGVTFWIIDVKPTSGSTNVTKEIRIDANSGSVISVKDDVEDADDKGEKNDKD
ncbi:MAG: PepSY domain-containing protein [Candidatus Obscuribacterales bacterium]|nr:PepSY domain-containing protein [Candidatus Obscuribacterales bacterium]